MAEVTSLNELSRNDVLAAISALAGEMDPQATQRDVDMILDSMANRAMEGKSLHGVLTERGQYDAMRGTMGNRDRGNAKTNGGQVVAREALRSMLTGRPNTALDGRIGLALQALDNVYGTGVSRGIAQGATSYRNPDVAKSSWHARQERTFGSLEDETGSHRFTGPGFWDRQVYDPISLHGQLTPPQTPAPVEIDNYNVPIPDNLPTQP